MSNLPAKAAAWPRAGLIVTIGLMLALAACQKSAEQDAPATASHSTAAVQELAGDPPPPPPVEVTVDDITTLKPTGDALLDRLAAALFSLPPTDNSLIPALPFNELKAEIAGWQAEFENDSRYWQLRYLSERPRRINEQEVQWTLEQIDATIARGHNDLALLYNMFISIDTICGDERTVETLEKLIAVAPDNAWPHYLLAMHRLGYSDLERALSELELGNAAPDGAIPLLFLEDELLVRAPRGRFIGNAMVSRILMLGPGLWRVPNLLLYIGELARTRLTAQQYLEQPELFEAYHQFACRIAVDRSATYVTSYYASQAERQMITTLFEAAELKLSKEQYQTLDAMARVLDRLGSLREETAAGFAERTQGSYSAELLAATPETITPELKAEWARHNFRAENWQRQFLKDNVVPLYNLLAQVDMTTLAMPPELAEWIQEHPSVDLEPEPAGEEEAAEEADGQDHEHGHNHNHDH